MTERIKNSLAQLNLNYDDQAVDRLIDYYKLLTEWNQKMNLTAITEFEEVVQKHFVDSLSIIRVQNPAESRSIVDVGTGAGFPGMVIKILYPQTQMTLIDSLNKRILFLREVAESLKLNHIDIIHGRAEELASDETHKENYELCVSRAVANLSTLSEYCLPFVKPGGIFIAYKSGNAEEEIENARNAIHLLGGAIEKTDIFRLPGSDMSRILVKVRKERHTPAKYPRKAGMPAKKPL